MSNFTNSGLAHCVIKQCCQPEPMFSFKAVALPKVCSNQPKLHINVGEMKHSYSHLKLADCQFHITGPIGMLIGAELVSQVVFLEIRINIWHYFARKNKLFTSCNNSQPLLNCHVYLDDNIDLQLQKFWEIEQIAKPPSLSAEDKSEKVYCALTFRELSGRFSVPLPFRHSNPQFMDTYSQASYRFQMLENRFLKNSELHKKYVDFMQDYLDCGHMSLVPQNEFNNFFAYYIVHHAVFKNQSSGSTIRVVFDASLRVCVFPLMTLFLLVQNYNVIFLLYF